MDKAYQVLIFPLAEADLADTKDYFENVLKTSSTRIFEKLIETVDHLEENPMIYPLAKDITLREKGYRFVPIDNFLLFFVVIGHQVQIRRFLYGGRKFNSLL
jgi:toxin ParE1/3/4